MNPIVCYFLLQLVGLYGMLLVLDYIKRPGSRYLETPRNVTKFPTSKKNSEVSDKAA